MGRRPGERGGGSDKGILLASPSHLFFPLRQAVQARAPRLGMCDWLGCDGESCCWGMPCGGAGPPMRWAAMLASLPFWRRRLLGWPLSEPLEMAEAVGLRDMAPSVI